MEKDMVETATGKKQWSRYFKAWREVRHDPEIRDFDHRLLKEIEDCQGKDSYTWIAQGTLAERLNKSRQYTNERIILLRKKGLLRVLKKRHKKTLRIALKCQLQFTPYVNPSLQTHVNPGSHNHDLLTITQDNVKNGKAHFFKESTKGKKETGNIKSILKEKRIVEPKPNISKEFQVEALRYAEALEIDLDSREAREKNLKARWFKFFKQVFEKNQQRYLNEAFAFVADYEKPLNPEGKVKMFFWKFNEVKK